MREPRPAARMTTPSPVASAFLSPEAVDNVVEGLGAGAIFLFVIGDLSIMPEFCASEIIK